MKKYKSLILIILLFISMSLIGIAVFWILENIFKFSFNSIIYSGIKAGIISSIILLLMDKYQKVKNKE